MTTVLYFHSLWSHRGIDTLAAVVAQYGIAVPLVAVVAGWLRRRSLRISAALIGGAVVATVLDLLAGHLYVHPRPFVVLQVAPLLPHSADNSFPSDHSVVAAYCAAALVPVDRTWAGVAIAAAILIGIARVYCLLHWPSDVLTAWVIGVAAAVVANYVAARARFKSR